MENMMGLLSVHVQRGVNLAVRDMRSSDPYVVVKMGKQKLKTGVVKRNVNPVWDETLTLSVTEINLPITLCVYDKDRFSFDDKMGDAEFEIALFIKVLRMRLEGLPDGTVITKVQPNRENCLAEESCIIWSKGKLVQTWPSGSEMWSVGMLNSNCSGLMFLVLGVCRLLIAIASTFSPCILLYLVSWLIQFFC